MQEIAGKEKVVEMTSWGDLQGVLANITGYLSSHPGDVVALPEGTIAKDATAGSMVFEQDRKVT